MGGITIKIPKPIPQADRILQGKNQIYRIRRGARRREKPCGENQDGAACAAVSGLTDIASATDAAGVAGKSHHPLLRMLSGVQRYRSRAKSLSLKTEAVSCWATARRNGTCCNTRGRHTT